MPAKTTAKRKPRKASTTAKPRNPLTKAQVDRVAKMRRNGATWKQVYTALKRKYGGCRRMRELLEAGGYDRFGRKDGKGTSKAHGWGSGSDENVQPDDTGRSPVPRSPAPPARRRASTS